MLLTVLDAFHFDHETLSKEIEAAKNKKTDGKSVTTATLNFLLTHTELNMTNVIYQLQSPVLWWKKLKTRQRKPWTWMRVMLKMPWKPMRLEQLFPQPQMLRRKALPNQKKAKRVR